MRKRQGRRWRDKIGLCDPRLLIPRSPLPRPLFPHRRYRKHVEGGGRGLKMPKSMQEREGSISLSSLDLAHHCVQGKACM